MHLAALEASLRPSQSILTDGVDCVVWPQLCLSSLRSDVQLQRFNRELRRYNYDLLRWKRSRRFHARETTLLDADGGAGWELAAQVRVSNFAVRIVSNRA